MTRYIIKRTMTQGCYKGRVCYFGKRGWKIDTRRPVSEQAYASRNAANNARRALEQHVYTCERLYEVVPVKVGTMI